MTAIVMPAPLWRRLTAAVYDLLLLLALWLATDLVLLITADQVGLKPGVGFTRIFLFTLSFAFFGWFWTHGGQTLGMRVWRLQLRRFDGSPLNWTASMRRFAVLIPLGLSVLWCWTNPARRAWHDALSETEVILLPKTS